MSGWKQQNCEVAASIPSPKGSTLGYSPSALPREDIFADIAFAREMFAFGLQARRTSFIGGRKEVADRGRWAEFSAIRRHRHVFGKQA
jgi:hypothetical protein